MSRELQHMYDLPHVSPFSRGDWHGQIWALDSTPVHDFTQDDLKCVHYASSSGDSYDGNCAAVFELKDGRFVAYESDWGPTGNGFAADAYGGGSDIFMASSLEDAIRLGLSKTYHEHASSSTAKPVRAAALLANAEHLRKDGREHEAATAEMIAMALKAQEE